MFVRRLACLSVIGGLALVLLSAAPDTRAGAAGPHQPGGTGGSSGAGLVDTLATAAPSVGARSVQRVGRGAVGGRVASVPSRLLLPSVILDYPVTPRKLTKVARRDWQPAFSPDSRTIVYVSEDLQSGIAGLRVVPLDGSGSRPVPIEGLEGFGRPSFTRDGQWLIFTARVIGGGQDTDIYRVRLDGSGLANLTNSPDIAERRAALSPDAKWLVYDAIIDDNQDLYRLDLATGRRTRLTDEPANDLLASVASDGQTLVFRSERDGNPELYRMRLDGRELVRLTDHPATDTYGSLVPSRSRVVFQSDRDGQPAVLSMNADGGDLRWLTDRRMTCMMPAVSPDSNWVAAACDDQTGNRDIYVWPADGSAAGQALALTPVRQLGGYGVRALAAHGDLAYVNRGPRLVVLRVADPKKPVTLGQVLLPAMPVDAALDGRFCYLAAGTDGLLVVDVHDPAEPRLVARLASGWMATAIDVAGSVGYVASDRGDLWIADLQIPQKPAWLGHLSLGRVNDIAASGSIAWIAGAGLTVVDATDGRAPRVLAKANLQPFSSSEALVGVAVEGSLVFALSRWTPSGLIVVDGSDPLTPTVLGSVSIPQTGAIPELSGTDYEPLSIAVQGEQAWLGYRGYLTSIDVADARRPRFLCSATLIGPVWKAAVAGSSVLVASEWGLIVLDRGVPLCPKEVGRYPAGDELAQIAVTATRAYLAGAWEGLRILDIADPTRVSELGRLTLPGVVQGVAVSGTLAIVAAGTGGLRVVDVGNDRSPRELGSVRTSGPARAVALVGHTAYVATETGLDVVDLAAPTAPSILGHVDLDFWPARLAVYAPTAYVVGGPPVKDSRHGTAVVDVADPRQPRFIGPLPMRPPGDPGGPPVRSGAWDVAVHQGRLYTVDSYQVQVFDLENPRQPTFVRMSRLRRNPWSLATACQLALDGEVAVVSGPDGWIELHDMQDLPRRRPLAEITVDEVPSDVAISNGRVIVVGERTVRLYESALSRPMPAVELWDGWAAHTLAVAGQLVFVGVSGAGPLRIVSASGPDGPTDLGSRRLAEPAANAQDVRALVSAENRLYAVLWMRSSEYYLGILDPTDRQPLRIKGRTALQESAVRLSVHGSLAATDCLVWRSWGYPSYRNWADRGFQIVDVTDASDPKAFPYQVFGTSTVSPPELADGHLFIGVEKELRAYSLENPRSPRQVGSLRLPDTVSLIRVVRGLAYVVSSDKVLRVVDVSLPDRLRERGSVKTFFVADIAVSGVTVYLAGYHSGLLAVEVTDPRRPYITQLPDTPGAAMGLAASLSHLYVADGDGGLAVFETGR